MIPSLQDLCLQEISQNTGFYQNSSLPNSLSDEFAKLSFDTGVLESDLTLIAGVTTLNAKFPRTMDTLNIFECDGIHPDMQLLPNVKNLIITHVEAHNAGLELSVDE